MRQKQFAGCPVCGGPASRAWTDPPFWRCAGCALLFRDPLPSAAELDTLYRASWADPAEHREETGGTDLELGRLFATELSRSLGTNLDGLRILDFGAGAGMAATALTERGARVTCVEPYGFARLVAAGMDVVPSLDGLPRYASFDGIVSLEVLEHLAELRAVLVRLRKLLAPGGWLFVSTPNARGLNARLSGPRWREAKKEGHLMLYTAGSLETVLARAGYSSRRLRLAMTSPRSYARRVLHAVLRLSRLQGGLHYVATPASIEASGNDAG